MLYADRDIYASAPLRQLVQTQTRAMLPCLQRCTGDHALLVGTCVDDVPPALPLLGCWTRLCTDAGAGYLGDLRASRNEPLPFVDDAFDLLLLRHALDAVHDPSALLTESLRVLAPGGVLVITGVHPLSGWSPWMYWRGRDVLYHLHLPLGLGQRLRHAGLELDPLRRVGNPLPKATHGSSSSLDSVLGGGYILVARKRHRSVTPLRPAPLPLRVASNNQLSPSAPRSAAQSRSKEQGFQ